MNPLPLIFPAPDMMGEVRALLDRSCTIWTETEASTQEEAMAALSRFSHSSCDHGLGASQYAPLRLWLCVHEGTGWNLNFPKDTRYTVGGRSSAENCRDFLGYYVSGCANPESALATARYYAEVHQAFGGEFAPDVERLLEEGDGRGRRTSKWARSAIAKPHPLDVKRSAAGGLAPELLVHSVAQLFSEGPVNGLTFQEVRARLGLDKDDNPVLQRALNECLRRKSVFELNPGVPGNPRPGERVFVTRR